MRTRRSTRAAFTLIEVLLVVVLLGLLAVFLWPDFNVLLRGERLDESVTRAKALVGMCRAQAMNESRRYRITLLPDGSLRLTRQKDPLAAPQEYVRIGDGWARLDWLLDGVWIDAVQSLPDGPPPLNVEDDSIEFFELDTQPQRLEEPLEIDFEPDGTCSSVRWILRDELGRGRELTLDGRLGRVAVAPLDRVDPDQLDRPEPQETPIDELESERISP